MSTQTVDDVFELLVSITLSVLLLVIVTFGINTYLNIQNKMEEERLAKEHLTMLMEMDKYDNTIVSGSQVLRTILEFRNKDIGVYIQDKNVYYILKYNESNKSYESGALKEDDDFLHDVIMSTNVDVDSSYKSEIVYDENDGIALIKFKKI